MISARVLALVVRAPFSRLRTSDLLTRLAPSQAFFMVSSTQAQAPIDLKSACNYLVIASSAITTNSASSYDGHFGTPPSPPHHSRAPN